MDLTPYVDSLRRELGPLGPFGPAAPLEPVAHLTLLKVVSAAMDEVTRELAPGSVDVRLRGTDLEFVVTPPPAEPPSIPTPLPIPTPAEEGEGVARVNLRLPAHLKTRAEEAAARDGLSVNAWLVRAVTAAADGTHPQQNFNGWVR